MNGAACLAEDWIQQRLGCVFGRDGRGGTGIFIDLEDGGLALLTARHVVVGCILTGEVTVGRLDRPGLKSIAPTEIRIDNRRDAAFLLVDREILDVATVPHFEWSNRDVEISHGMVVIVSGVVGEWKAPDSENRRIPQIKTLHLNTQVVDPEDSRGRIVCYVDERHMQMPSSFKGMSGGPCFSEDRRILGIITEEVRRKPGTHDGEILVTRLADLRSLFEKMQPALSDLTVQRQASMDFWAASDNPRGCRVNASVFAQFLSVGNPFEVSQERIGRIIAMKIVTPPAAERYIIQCCSTFTWSGGYTDEELQRALEEELAFFLRETGFTLASTVQFFDRQKAL